MNFPILSQQVHGRPLVYLDNAATTQKPQEVLDAILEAYTTWNANIHRGVHHLSQVATAHHEESRETIASFLGARSAREIIFTRGTTEAINLLALSFGEAFVHEGDEIVISALEHHSNLVPWQMLSERRGAHLKVVPLRADLTLDMEAYRQMLSERTRIVSIAMVSNVLGTIQPVEEIVREAHRRHIPVCIDGAQAAPHMMVNVEKLGCDFFVCSAHKMYGPTGMGVLYGREEWLDRLPPVQGGGEMIEHVSYEKTTYNVLPYKFEAGTPDFIGSYAFAEAIRWMKSQGRTTMYDTERALMHYAEMRLATMKGVHIYAAGREKAGALSFNVFSPSGQLIHPFDIGTLLDQQGIAVRTGHHCAEPLMGILEVPGTVRMSVAIYNTHEDIDRFISALQRAISMLE